MKKIISITLVIIFVFTISACNSNDTSSIIDKSTTKQSETFIKLENYASILLISINTQFKLYLDENNNVLAVGPVNEDAKSFSNIIDFENKSIETVISDIVEQANDKGFIKENTEDSSSKTESTETSKPTIPKPIHTHSYSDATCTTPQKCSCGQIKGSTLGHKWQEATCKEPKTCSVCKATEGNIGAHKYTKGKCTYCNEKQIINPKKQLKTSGNYYEISNDGDGNYTLIIYISKFICRC